MRHSRILSLLLLGMLAMLAACTNATTVEFDNRTVCGTIEVQLTNTQSNVTETYQVEVGKTISIDVAPNVTYNYVVDYTSAGTNEQGYECIAIQRGQVTVPLGATQRFNLTAVTPTPSSAP